MGQCRLTWNRFCVPPGVVVAGVVGVAAGTALGGAVVAPAPADGGAGAGALGADSANK
jgi:hypothetical protein